MENAPPCSYPGKPLEFGDSFRLIELQPGSESDPITVRLLDCTLESHPEYEAVSYAWGDLSLTADIQISYTTPGTQENVILVSATANCQDALKSLRQPDRVRVMWIDAICINQGLVKERNHQVELMANIYRNASRVVIYLGESADDSDAVMHWIEELDDAPDYGEPDAERPPAPAKEAIRALLARPWFHRVWVLQEITFGKDPIVICGGRSIGWEAFRRIRYAITDGGSFVDMPYSFSYPQEDLDFEYDRNLISYAERLFKQLRASRHCGATDPRDKLYAILPLVESRHKSMLSAMEKRRDDPDGGLPGHLNLEAMRKRLGLRPDYNLSAAEVFTQVAKTLIGPLGAMRILRSVQTPRLVPGLPSWVPDWSTTTLGSWDRGNRHYRYDWRRMRWAEVPEEDTPSPGVWRLSDYTLPTGGLSSQIHLQALSIGSISQLGDICDLKNNVLPIYQWWDLAKDPGSAEELWPDTPSSETSRHRSYPRRKDQSKRLQQFWDTLGTEERWTHRIEPLVLAMVDQYVRQVNGNQYLPKRYIAKSDQGTKSLDAVIGEWPRDSNTIRAKKIFGICDEQRFFVTDSGYMGLAPAGLDIKVGDSLHVVEGWDTVFALRSCNVAGNTGSNNMVDNASEVLPAEGGNVGRIFNLQGEVFMFHRPSAEESGSEGDDLQEEVEEIVVR